MPIYDTKPIDYTGCHPVIAEYLKRGEMVKCRVGTNTASTDTAYIRDYDAEDKVYVTENRYN